MTAKAIRAMIASAALAPSVHNVQPARWRIEADGATLFEAVDRRLPAADPHGRDASLSLGAAAEGFRLAAGEQGYGITVERLGEGIDARLRAVARLRLQPGGTADPLALSVGGRQSWRGDFTPPGPADRAAAAALASDDCAVILDPAFLRDAGKQLDAASWTFMRDTPFRDELKTWMRLSPRHRHWSRDGLNREAMAMGAATAAGAGLVLGPLFAPLAAVGLARPLLAEGARLAGDTGLVLFHRPRDEAPFDSGAHFYRLWLRIEAAGFAAAVLASIADHPDSAAWACDAAGIGDHRRLISAWRIGRRPAGAGYRRARLTLGELIIG